MVIIYNILLVCSAGMSTSLLVDKMRAVAKEQGIEVNINAIAEADLKNYLKDANVLLLGPQVRYMLSKIKSMPETQGIPVEVISTVDYGMMRGDKVLDTALNLIQGK